MFAVDHAATALLIKRRYPSVSLAPILVSVQAMELAWVGLNYLGIERTTTEATVRSVADVHLASMPYSHSVITASAAAVAAWLIIEKGFGRAALGRAVGLGIVSHLILDLATHGHDIVLWPGRPTPKLGLGLYESAPIAAFVVEFLYGIVCWYVYRGDLRLLAFIALGNAANLSFLSPAIPGPEGYLAGRPTLLVTVIFVQIVVTLVLVAVLARRKAGSTTNGRSPRSTLSRLGLPGRLMGMGRTFSPWSRWLTAVVLLHLAVSFVHGAAHAGADVPLSPAANLFVYIVILAGPIVGLALTRLGWRIGPWVIAITMAASLVFGVVNHFLLASPDHVSHVAQQWRTLFATTAVLLALTEAVGTGLAICVSRERTHVP